MKHFRLAALLAAGLVASTLSGCASQTHEEEEACGEIKPGVVTSVNSMCAVVTSDPVNPALTPVVWKGQKVGFCCKGCIPRWEKMTEAEKDASLAKAMATPLPTAVQ